MSIRYSRQLILTAALFSALAISPAFAQGALVNLPGLGVQTDGGNVSIDMPGLSVDTSGGGAVVNTPGVNVQAPTYAPAPTRVVRTVRGGGTSYVNAELTGMDFHGQNLAGADFTNATLTNTDFSNADLRGAIFKNTDLTNTNFANANLEGADFTNANLIGTNLTNANLSRADLTNVTIEGALASGARFDGAVLTNVDMSLFIRQPATRVEFTNAQMISSALKVDPAHPKAPRKIDLTINFDFNSDKLTADGSRQVAEIATALKSAELSGNRILVEGHTDDVGSDAYNEKLSNQRAMRVILTLRDQYGIPNDLLSGKGYGEKRPIANNNTDLGRAMNRRVTLVNLGK